MDRDQLKPLINFIATHETGIADYVNIKNKSKIIDKGIDMAYDYVLSDEYSLKDLVK